jgi:hypothetical protein
VGGCQVNTKKLMQRRSKCEREKEKKREKERSKINGWRLK